jgi:aspartate 1-decarboxylase
MLRRLCRSKIHRATVTASQPDYEGSIEIDETLMKAAGLLEFEIVLVANIANGARFETYVIKGRKNSGVIGLRGAAARLGTPGQKLIIMSVALMSEAEARKLKPKFIQVNDQNKIIDVRSVVKDGPVDAIK